MKCVIIGCGWLGKPLALHLKSLGHEVVGSVRGETSFVELLHEGIQAFRYEGEENSMLPPELQKSDWLIICFPPSKSFHYSTQVKEIISQLSRGTKILFTSTTGVYSAKGIVDEEGTIYEDHIVFEAEQFIRNSDNSYVILRLAGLIGGNRHPINQLAGRRLENGQDPVNLVSRNDVIRAVELIIDLDISNELFNLCYPDHPSRADYYTKQAHARNLALPTFSMGNEKGKQIDGSRIEKMLKFTYQEAIS
jgi:nucleoside-diphosphate-sugar epimerase